MDDLVEIVFEIVFEVVVNLFDGVFNNIQPLQNQFDAMLLNNIERRETYISGLIATTVALSYHDDQKLDKHEKKMISDLIKNHHDVISKKTRKNIKYIKKQKLTIENLSILFVKLDVDNETIVNIINDLGRILKSIDKDTSKQLEFLNHLHQKYNKDYNYHY